MKRIIGLDYGGRHIGVSMSDPLGWTAQGLCVITRKDDKEYRSVVSKIKELAAEYGAGVIVIGYPKNMDGSEGANCARVLEFKSRLEKSISGVEVALWDERLSTRSAMRVLDEAALSYKKKNKIIDKQAAVIILQAYLDFINQKEKKRMIEENFNEDDFDEDEFETVTLTNEDGEEIECLILESIEYEGVEYLLVIEAVDDEDDEVMPFILKSVGENEDDMVFESITDDDEYEKVVALFNELSDEFDLE